MKFFPYIVLFCIAALSVVSGCDLSKKSDSLANDTTISLEAREWSKKIDEYPDNAEYYVFRAEVLTKENRHDLAILDFKKAIELQPKVVSHYYMLGDAYFADDQTTKALEQYQKATDLDPTDETAAFKEAQFLYFVRQFDKSELIFGKLLQLNPNHAQGNFFMGMLGKEKKDTSLAIQYFKNTIAALGADYNSSMQLGDIYMALGDNKQALQYYNAGINIDQQSDEAYYARGLFFHVNNQYEKALEDYQRTIDINAKHYLAYYNAGNILADLGKYDRAIDHFEICTKLNPDLAKGYNRLGQCMELKGEIDLAERNYERCLQIDPNFALAKE
ncbi:MAG: hypothetical protein RLZZ337_1315, partial [Bacteroidota bacterium]